MLDKPWAALTGAMSSWHQARLFIEHSVSIDHDALHVLVGVLLWVVLAIALRRPLSSWLPWSGVFAVILWNEAVDLWIEQWPNPGEQYGEGVKDLLLTMFLPTVLMGAVRLRPDLFRSGFRKRR